MGNQNSPENADPSVLQGIDQCSIWAYWARQYTHPLTHPFSIAGRADPTRIATGYVYDLKHMPGFEPPDSDLSNLIRDLLHEAAVLRMGSVPPRAIVEINFPPFVALELQEIGPDFITVDALDRDRRCLPVYLFPMQLQWSVPNTGVGPGNTPESFQKICQVIATISSFGDC